MQIEGGVISSGDAAEVTINVESNGTLSISRGTTTVNGPVSNNPIANWTKTTYTPNSGTITIEFSGSDKKNLDTAITADSNTSGVEELHHYKKTSGDNQALRLKKGKKHIYYRESTTGDQDQNPTITWIKYNGTKDPSDADVKTLVKILDRLGTFKEFLKSLVKIISHA